MLWILDLPLGACRRMREGNPDAEVCPASWKADHLIIREAGNHAAAKATTEEWLAPDRGLDANVSG